MRRGNRPSERPESTNGPEDVHVAQTARQPLSGPRRTPPDGYSPRARPAGKGDGPVSGPRTRLPPQPIDSIILIALACFLGIGSRRYAHSLPEFIAVYAGETLWASAAFLGIGLILPRVSTWIDSIRQTTLGGLILGFGFLWSDLVCYALGVELGVLVETMGGIVSREDGS